MKIFFKRVSLQSAQIAQGRLIDMEFSRHLVHYQSKYLLLLTS